MISRSDLRNIRECLWELPKGSRPGMLVPAWIYANEAMLTDIFRDRSIDQLANLATLPGIESHALVMPDVHEGYGSPIGGVFATRASDGVISPGAVGYDINCGVRLLLSSVPSDEIRAKLPDLTHEIARNVPSGVGRGHSERYGLPEIDDILKEGSSLLVRQGYGSSEDIACTESGGRLEWADPQEVSERAKMRGTDQVGTLGSGNHFLEIQRVDRIFDPDTARSFGMLEWQLCIMIHTGSRGLWHQIATDHIRVMLSNLEKYGIDLVDRELACAPFHSDEWQRYFAAMAAGANFAWANRQMITHLVRESWARIIGSGELRLLYDVGHNMAKWETHQVDGKILDLVVHRKGATRAFPPWHPELPERYKETGQPVLIPGSMGTASYVLAGTADGRESFYSACHGAGRIMSRHEAMWKIGGRQLVDELESKGIIVESHFLGNIAEEAPLAYKDIDMVVDIVHTAGLAKKVARMVPLAVIKGD